MTGCGKEKDNKCPDCGAELEYKVERFVMCEVEYEFCPECKYIRRV